MSEQTVKIEIEVPVEVKRFLDALQDFTGQDVNKYLAKVLVQGILDSINPETWTEETKAIRFEDIKKKHGLDALCEKVMDP